MKNFLLAAGILLVLVSCKVSENITVDQVSKSSGLTGMKTFQVINQTNSERDIQQLNRIFERRLIEKGFTPTTENPDLLVQSVISSVDFETTANGGGTVGTGLNTVVVDQTKTTSGEYGKVMFLIQDAKTNEVLWMGIGTGILSSNQQLNKKEIFTALNQMTTGLR